jgi:hypothetical protein
MELYYIYIIYISTIIREVCAAICQHLETRLALPTAADGWTKIADEFEKHANFPPCIGAVDGKYIRLFQPTNSGSLYRVIINDCPIVVGVGDVVECAASLIT